MWLDLSRTKVTDDSLEHLKSFPKLKMLFLRGLKDVVDPNCWTVLGSITGVSELPRNRIRSTEAMVLRTTSKVQFHSFDT